MLSFNLMESPIFKDFLYNDIICYNILIISARHLIRVMKVDQVFIHRLVALLFSG